MSEEIGREKMHYATIKYCDIANGEGVRTSLFVSGCRHHCKECFNQVAWDFDYGEEFTKDTEDRIISSLSPSYIRGLSLLGGEPMEKENQGALLDLIKRVKVEAPDKDTASTVKDNVQTYLDDQSDSFQDYIPEESKRIGNAVLEQKDQYVILCVSGDSEGAKEIIEKAFK